MSLAPLVAPSQSTLREMSKTHFKKGGYVVTHPCVIPARRRREENVDVLGILLKESCSAVRAACYQFVLHKMHEDSKFRMLVTESLAPVLMDQIIDMDGYGIFTMSEPIMNRHVRFSYYARVNGHFMRPSFSLGTCDLGCVVPTPPSILAS